MTNWTVHIRRDFMRQVGLLMFVSLASIGISSCGGASKPHLEKTPAESAEESAEASAPPERTDQVPKDGHPRDTNGVDIQSIDGGELAAELHSDFRRILRTSSGKRADFGDLDAPVRDALQVLNDSKSTQELLQALGVVSRSLHATSVKSNVRFRTSKEGARVRYRLHAYGEVKDAPVLGANELTNADGSESIVIGFYYIWAERAGVATSSMDALFKITSKELTVELEEK